MSSFNSISPLSNPTAGRFGKHFQQWLYRRIPPQKKITLTQRSIFIFPSKTGLVFFTLLLLLLFGAINYQNSLIYGVTFLLGSLFLVTILHTYKNLSDITLQYIQSTPGFVEENINFQIKISRPNASPREGIQLGWPAGLKQWAQLTKDESCTLHLFVPATHRGWMQPGRLLLETYYPLGLLRAWTWIDFGCKALVYPKPLFNDAVTKIDTNHSEGEITQPDGNDDFYEMRSYREGDPIKHIAWRNYARSDELMVKQFAEHKDAQLILDWYQLEGDTENRLSRLTGLALTASRCNQEFGLRLPAKEIPPGSGATHLEHILRELALYQHV